jgi:hypothetical protein
MPSAIAGTIDFNTQVNAGSGTTAGVCIDSTGTFAYCTNSAGKVYQFTVATGVASGGSWPVTGLTSPTAICLSPDDLTLYVLQDNGQIYTIPVASPAATLLGTVNNFDGQTGLWRSMLFDPANVNRLLLCNQGNVAKKIYAFDVPTVTASYYYDISSVHNPVGLGVVDRDTDSLLVTATGLASVGQSGAILLRFLRRQQRMEVLLGTGAAGNTTGAGPAQGFTNVMNVNNQACGDADGRIYIGRANALLTKIETDKTVTDINATLPANVAGGCVYSSAVNRIILGASGARVLFVK